MCDSARRCCSEFCPGKAPLVSLKIINAVILKPLGDIGENSAVVRLEKQLLSLQRLFLVSTGDSARWRGRKICTMKLGDRVHGLDRAT